MTRTLIMVALALAGVAGCQKEKDNGGLPAPADGATADPWRVELVREMTGGLKTPECVVVEAGGDAIYISNILTPNEGYWEDDGAGFVNRVTGSGEVLRWLDSTPAFPLHAPKGMALCGDKLYFNDNTELKRCDARTGANPQVVPGVSGQRLNDLATDGESVYATDTATGTIYRVKPDGSVTTLKGPESVNGIALWQGRIFAVSWDRHDLYEVDPAGGAEAAAFGLADHFTALDGIEVMADGTFIVSDFQGNKVCAVSPDRTGVTTLAELETPADIGVDRDKGLLYVPQFARDKVLVYRLGKM